MANLRQIRRRLRFIQNTKAIMRAMQLVSASKLKRTQARLLQIRVVSGYLSELVERVAAESANRRIGERIIHPLCERRPSASASALVIITSDTGLCGAYNTNLISLAEAQLKADSRTPVQLVLIGRQGARYFTKRGYRVMASYPDLAGRPNPSKARQIAMSLVETFLNKRVDNVRVVYTRFVSATVYRPTVEQWLPIEPANRRTGEPANESEYIFEPSPRRVFDELLPRTVLAKFQLMMLEAFTSEHSARMIAMKNATDNATELLDALTLQRNKIRQAAITKELSEIVGTAEALK